MVDTAKDRQAALRAFHVEHAEHLTRVVTTNHGGITFVCDCGIIATADDIVAGILEAE
jgi:hypothetical protein